MKLSVRSFVVVGLCAVSATACAAKLSVGDDRQGGPGQDTQDADAGDAEGSLVEPDGGSSAPADASGGPSAASGGSGPSEGSGGSGSIASGSAPPGSVVPSSGATAVPSEAAGGAGGAAELDPGGASGMAEPSLGGAAGVGGTFSQGVAGSAGASVDDGNSWVEEAMPTEPAPGSTDGCPVGPLRPDSACDSPGLTCAYHFAAAEYQECACLRRLNSESIWQCFTAGGQQQGSCPAETPLADADCYGYYGLSCWYPPETQCSCDSEPGVWQCVLPPDLDVPDPPQADSEAVLIPELTAEQRQAWCEWYAEQVVGGPGHAPTPDLPVDDSGYTTNGACRSGSACPATLPVVSAAQCAANLSLSKCEAPLSLLTACVAEPLSGACLADEYACVDLAETPNCSSTLVTVSTSGFSANCTIQVSDPDAG